MGQADRQTLIETSDLAACLADADTLVFDCRFSLADPGAGRQQWQQDHIPGARYADLNQDLSAPVIPGKTGRHPLPSPTHFCDWLARMGVSNHSKVVAYDEGSGAFAARLWWMLRWVGHSRVAVLNGGYNAWRAAGLAQSAEAPDIKPGNFLAGASLTRTLDADALPDADLLLLDARDEARYLGREEPIDPVAGHIPGAICAPFSGNLTSAGLLQNRELLRARFAALGAGNQPVACYCGSGVTATHNILALVHAGFAEPALYAGSWSEWITDPGRPVATG